MSLHPPVPILGALQETSQSWHTGPCTHHSPLSCVSESWAEPKFDLLHPCVNPCILQPHSPAFHHYLFLSRCWESNPGLTHSLNNRPVAGACHTHWKGIFFSSCPWHPSLAAAAEAGRHPSTQEAPLSHWLTAWAPALGPQPPPCCSSQCNKRAQWCSRDVLTPHSRFPEPRE